MLLLTAEGQLVQIGFDAHSAAGETGRPGEKRIQTVIIYCLFVPSKGCREYVAQAPA
jgi:hypothetical protein